MEQTQTPPPTNAPKSEFFQAVERVSEELRALLKADDRGRAFILIANEDQEGEDSGNTTMVNQAGIRGNIVMGIKNYITDVDTHQIYKEAALLTMLESVELGSKTKNRPAAPVEEPAAAETETEPQADAVTDAELVSD